ncbi:DUF2637 domain-containing protein [Streptomyces niveus]|uniref:DUF2637 domain-containing protein n=1 Tax=Streptomyces niveus TaxID=193462 RepID=UPI00364A879B
MKSVDKPKILLVVALVVVVGMAFRVSWNALYDVARALGMDTAAATLYPFVVDGLMALALIATLVLVGRDKKLALRVLGGYTLASLILNFVHGAIPELHGQSVGWGELADRPAAYYSLVLLATSLPVGAIFFGSDLVAKILHHRPDTATDDQKSTQIQINRSMSDLGESTPEPVTTVAAPEALPAPVVVDVPAPVGPVESTRTLAPVAAESTRPRGATGRVPDAARTPRPKRTPDQLLSEARKLTADWSDGELTAEAIRKGVRTSAEKARGLRDTLRAERESADDAVTDSRQADATLAVA